MVAEELGAERAPRRDETRGAASVAAVAGLSIRYMFSIDAPVDGRAVGEVPGGYRVDIHYIPASGAGGGVPVTTDASKAYASWLPRGAEASVIAKLEEAGFAFESTSTQTDQARARIWAAIEELRDPEALAGQTQVVDRAKFDAARAALVAGKRWQHLEWFGLSADVLSGSDWALIRTDGVAEFSGRVALRSRDAERAVLNMRVAGAVDLQAGPEDPRRDIFQRWKNGTLRQPTSAPGSGPVQVVELLLTATFECAKAAQSWAPQRYIRQGEGFWKHERLCRGQFIATGSGLFAAQRFSPLRRLRLDIYEIRP